MHFPPKGKPKKGDTYDMQRYSKKFPLILNFLTLATSAIKDVPG